MQTRLKQNKENTATKTRRCVGYIQLYNIEECLIEV